MLRSDLVILDAFITKIAELDLNFLLTWTIFNRGDAITSAFIPISDEESPLSGWFEAIYLSQDTTFDVNEDLEVTNLLTEGQLNSGENREIITEIDSTEFNLSLNELQENWNLLFVTDAFNIEDESDEENNVKAVSFASLIDSSPSISASGDSIEGELSSSDLNNPDRDGSFKDDFELVDLDNLTPGDSLSVSLDADFDAYLQLINADTQEIIDENDDREGGVTDSLITFSPDPETNYIVRVTSFDSGETGNYRLNLDKAGTADLKITNIQSSSSTAVVGHSEIALSWDVINQGNAGAAAIWSDAVYLSDDQVLDASDTFVDSFVAPNTLVAGASYSVSVTRTLPFTAAGDRYLLFVADLNDNQDEASEDNNIQALPIQLTLPEPDLTVAAASIPILNDPAQTLTVGQAIDVDWTVENLGLAAATSNWSDSVYFSSDSVFDPDSDLPLSSSQIGKVPLSSGESYSRRLSVTLPAGQGSSGYLFVITDRDRDLVESDETNNIFALPVQLQGANLKVSNPSSPASGSLSESIDVAWTVSNLGDIATTAFWYDTVFLSDDEQLDPSDLPLTNWFAGDDLPLAAGENYRATRQFRLPSDASRTGLGSKYLLFAADHDSTLFEQKFRTLQAETNEADNIVALPFELTAPNLTVASAEVPASVVPGESFEVSWIVKNTGTVAAPSNWFDAVYWSSDGVLDPLDTRLEQSLKVNSSPLASEEQYELRRSIRLPSDIPLVSSSLIFVVDDTSAQGETSETDNYRVVDIGVTAPDLIVEALPTAPSSAAAGETIEVAWTINNQGQVPAQNDWYDAVYLSSDTQLSSNDRLVYRQLNDSNQSLAAGGQYSLNSQITLPGDAQAGAQYLIFAADAPVFSTDSQRETDENNNNQAVAIELFAPNLVITTSGLPGKATVGGPLTLSWTVENQGQVTAFADWQDQVFLSDDERLDESDLRLTNQFIRDQTPLSPGSTYSLSADITLPINQEGQKYLIFESDINQQQSETNETDNQQIVPLLISDDGPNLAFSQVTAPNSAVLGETVAVSWKVINSGGIDASANWKDFVYLSDDEVLDASDIFIRAVDAGQYSPLAPAQDYEVSENFTIPRTDLGDRYLLFITDRLANQSETNEADNLYAHPIKIDALDIDLVVSNILIPAEAVAGQVVEIAWTVTNQGTDDATGTWSDRLVFSTDADPESAGNDTLIGEFPFSGTIAAGQSIERRQAFRLPETWSGDRYMVVTTDQLNQLIEFGNNDAEANNTAVGNQPVNVIPRLYPNLQITEFTSPNLAFSGQDVALEWVVKNAGNGPTSAPSWYEQIWLSLDQTLDGTDTLLGRATNPSYLEAGQSYRNRLTARLPQGLNNDYYLFVKADAGNQVDESSRENDNLSPPTLIPIRLTPPPDLTVTAVQTQGQALSGQPLRISWTVKNQGQGDTQNKRWFDKVYLSTDEGIDSSDLLLRTFVRNGSLNPDEQYTVEEAVELPIGISGDFQLLVQTDAENQSYEHTFEANNVAHSPLVQVSLTPPPDLEVDWVEAPTEATASRALEVNYQVTNRGATATPNGFWLDAVYLSTDQQLDRESDLRLGARSHYGQLQPNQSYEANATFTLPNGLAGQFYAFVVSDSENAVFELESENLKFDPVPLTITSKPVDLTVSGFTAPAEAESGQAIRVSWTVENQGIGDTAVSRWDDQIILSANAIIGDEDDQVLQSFVHRGRLGVGDSYSRNELITLPTQISGNYSLFVASDVSNLVYEAAAEINNDSTLQPISIRQITSDLQVTQVSAPLTALSGQVLTPSWTVQNFGPDVTSTNAWHDNVYLSNDQVLDSGDLLLGSAYRSGALEASAPNQAYQASQSFTLPVDLEGDFYTIIQTDWDDKVFEGEKSSNNARSTVEKTTISLSPTPDLQLSTVAAPQTGFAGQPIAINWTTINQGAATEQAWQDAFYLSRDRIFDPETDLYLGSAFQNTGQNTGSSSSPIGQAYSRTQTFELPRGLSGSFYLFGIADQDHRIYERNAETNNTAYDADAIEINLLPPADLIPKTVTVPANATLGQASTISYSVENATGLSIPGVWTDSIYLSADDQWDLNDPLWAQVEVDGLTAGDRYSQTATAPLPGLLPGDYHVIVRSDTRNVIPEGDETNNLTVSAETIAVDAEHLALEVEDTGTLQQGQSVYYRIDVAAGETLQVALDSSSEQSAVDLYLSYEKVPSRSQFDLTISEPLVADPSITVPTTQAGTYYVLAYGNSIPDGENYSISAKTLPFSLQSVDSPTVSNKGAVTLEIQGSQFRSGTTFELLDAQGNVLFPQRQRIENGSTAYATFALEKQELGQYDLQAKRQDGAIAQLEDVLTVETGTGHDVAVQIAGPNTVRSNRNYLFNIEVSNAGDSDLAAPLLLVQSETQTPMGGSLESFLETGSDTKVLQLLGTSGGYLDTLRPGEMESLPVYYRSSTDEVNFDVDAITVGNTLSADWDLIRESVRPLEVPEADWERFWGQIQPRIGETWGDYVSLLNELAVEYSTPDDPIQDVRTLFGQLYADNPNYLPSSKLEGQLLDASSGEILAGIDIAAYEVVNGDYALAGYGVTDDQGQFSIEGLEQGNYELALGDRGFDVNRDGQLDLDSPTYAIAGDADITGLEIFADSNQPAHVNDSGASVTVDAAGNTHIIWNRDGEMWHAYGENGQWRPAQKIEGAAGNNFQIQAANNLIDGSQAGLIATWRSGRENESEIYYAVGREASSGNGYEWSEAIALTNDSVYDDGVSLAIDPSGNAIFVYEKSDYAIEDDSDLYFKSVQIYSEDLTVPARTLSAEAGLYSLEHHTLSPSASFSQDFSLNKGGALPSFIPVIGGRNDIKIKGQISGSTGGKTVEAKGKLTGEIELFNKRAKGTVTGSVDAKWNLHKPSCSYHLSNAKLGLAGEIEANVPAFKFPLKLSKSLVLADAEIGLGVKATVDGSLTWGSNASFPSFPTGGSISLSSQQTPYGKAKILNGIGTGKISGSGAVSLTLLPNFKVNGASLTLTLTGQVAGWKILNFSRKWQVFGTSSLLSPLSDEPTLPEELTFIYDPAVGTGNIYGGNSVLHDVSTDLSEDRLVESAIAPDGTPWMLWSKETGDISGDQLLIATLNGDTWSTPTEVADDVGYLSSLDLTFDSQGNAVAAWSAVDSSQLTVDSSDEEIIQALSEGEIKVATYQNGTWSSPSDVFAAVGNDVNPVLGQGINGSVVLSWINQSGNVLSEGSEADSDRLMAAIWDGTAWTSAAQVDTGDIVGEAAVSVFNGSTAIFWSEIVGQDENQTETSLFYSIYDAQLSWQTPVLFTPETALVSASFASLGGPVSDSHNSGFSTASLSLPSPPQELCDHEEPEENPENPSSSRPSSGNPGGGGAQPDGGETEPDAKPDRGEYAPPIVGPIDPNDILGPIGFGQEQWIPGTAPLDYTIRFENEPNATAPAQTVVITQQLDPDLDWRTFRVDDFGWSGLYFDLPGDRPFYSDRLDFTEQSGFFVDVFTNIDLTTGLATWTLTTIDPNTGQSPLNALTGFLPINDENGIGEGFVSYSIKAKDSAQTGDRIDAKASIIFDSEPLIETPPIFNTLDVDQPTSRVNSLPDLIEAENGEFQVSWSGSDAVSGSGLMGYSVYVSENGGDFSPWLENTTLTTANYKGEPGHQYDFYAIATDNAGNIQTTPAEPQASTRLAGGVAAVGDFIWHDLNANGIQEEGEPGLANVTVNLYDENERLIDTATSDAVGFYQFSTIAPGDYFAEFITPDGFRRSPQNQGADNRLDSDGDLTTGRTALSILEGAQSYDFWDAGFYQAASITGQLWNDTDGNSRQDSNEPGLGNWTVFLDQNLNGQLDSGEISTQTATDGRYSFTDLRPGSYIVEQVVQEDWRQTYPQITTTASNIQLFTPSAPESFSTSAAATHAGELINLNDFRTDPRFQSIRGQGFASVVIDTGIDVDHPFFGPDQDGNGVADRIVYQYDFGNGDGDASDRNGHGSHVASIIGSGDEAYAGIAPEADIIALKVFSDSGSGYFSNLEKSLQWVIQNAEQYNIASVNLSLGDEQNWAQASSHYGIGDELAALSNLGIIVSAAIGNGFADFSSALGAAYPAADPNTISVGAVQSETGQIAAFSQRHPDLLDVFAPGIPITGANAVGGTQTLGGTSQAAPHIAGIAVLAQQIAQENLGRRLTVAEFKGLLASTGTVIYDGDDEVDSVQNSGLDFSQVNLQTLATAILELSPEAPASHWASIDSNGTETPLYLPEVESVSGQNIDLDSGQTLSEIDFGNQQLKSDLLTTQFDVLNDHVSLGEATINYTLTNQSERDVDRFNVDLVYSNDEILGNDDDQLLRTLIFGGLHAGDSLTGSVTIEIPRALLNNNALADDPVNPDNDHHISTSYDYLGFVIDPNDTLLEFTEDNNANQGKGIDMDDITYFPWDIDGNGQVTPTDALFVINHLGQTTNSSNAVADFDGNGVITPTEALTVINQLGTSINSSVME